MHTQEAIEKLTREAMNVKGLRGSIVTVNQVANRDNIWAIVVRLSSSLNPLEITIEDTTEAAINDQLERQFSTANDLN